jgi:hypothetical protein
MERGEGVETAFRSLNLHMKEQGEGREEATEEFGRVTYTHWYYDERIPPCHLAAKTEAAVSEVQDY